METEGYGDFHRKFLRTITAKGCVKLDVAEGYLERLRQAFDRPDATIQRTIQEMNEALKIFDQQLSIIRHEQFNEEYLVFSVVAPIPTLILQQKVMNANDYKYFEAVLRLLLTSDNYQVRHKMALTTQASSSRRSLLGDNENLLKLWTSLGYFLLVDGIVYLGPKTLVELKGFIHSEYPQIRSCDLCFSLTLLNHICRNCEKSFHQACLDRYWQSMPNSCPGCRQPWHSR